MKPKPIRSILEGTLRALEIDVPLKAYSILGAWEEIVGHSLAAQTRPRSIRNRILFIDVSHPTWIQELQFLKPTLLGKVNQFLGETSIHDIRFRVGKIPAPPRPQRSSPDWQQRNLEEETLRRIDSLVQSVDDGETKKALQDLFVRGARLGQHLKKEGDH